MEQNRTSGDSLGTEIYYRRRREPRISRSAYVVARIGKLSSIKSAFSNEARATFVCLDGLGKVARTLDGDFTRVAQSGPEQDPRISVFREILDVRSWARTLLSGTGQRRRDEEKANSHRP